jgi:hypothetical protein
MSSVIIRQFFFLNLNFNPCFQVHGNLLFTIFNSAWHSKSRELSLINAAQIKLSREEFLDFLLMCTTRRPHILIKDWSEIKIFPLCGLVVKDFFRWYKCMYENITVVGIMQQLCLTADSVVNILDVMVDKLTKEYNVIGTRIAPSMRISQA